MVKVIYAAQEQAEPPRGFLFLAGLVPVMISSTLYAPKRKIRF
jgi:hypothetical protein